MIVSLEGRFIDYSDAAGDIESIAQATHAITARDKNAPANSNRIKFTIAVALGCERITLEWLTESFQTGHFVGTDGFRLTDT